VERTPLHRTIPARADMIAPLRREVQAFAQRAGVLDPYGVALALSETVANAVLHAYAGAERPGEIVVHAEADDELVLTVEDRGRGMRPRPDSPGAGLGLPLVAHFAARFEVSDRPDGGTHVCMAFPTARERAPAAQPA
jgi:serine/threonine-protein kinase RsbW